MSIKDLSKPLEASQIEFRIQSINKGGYATILAYKDARVDMQRLDEAVGPLNWRREHVNGNHNCVVSLWDEEKSQWVSKEDTGTESNTEKEKGLASDSFKRACFNWGIGRELYDYPVIQVKLNSNEFELYEDRGKKKARATWSLKLKQWAWHTKFTDGQISFIAAIDEKGDKRFEWGVSPQITPKAKIDPEVKKQVIDDTRGADATNDHGKKEPTITAEQIANIDALIKEVGADKKAFLDWLKIDHIENLTQKFYANAINALEKKRG